MNDPLPTLFRNACERGNTEVVRALLYPSGNATDRVTIETIIGLLGSYSECCNLIIEDVRVDNNAPLRFACENGHHEIVRLLMTLGRITTTRCG
jgi:small nuclear ribonucleoprotein (snRNP)-like protein